jgi:hypothetical protein
MSAGFYSLFDFTGLPVGGGVIPSKVLTMLNEIFNAIVTDVTALNFILDGTAAPVVKRKGVKRQPGVDASTQITICKDSKKRIELQYVAFTKTSILYPISMAIGSPNKRDWLTNLDTYITWWESLITLYVPPSLASTKLGTLVVGNNHVWEVRVVPGDFLEPEDMANMFDVVSVDLGVKATLIA